MIPKDLDIRALFVEGNRKGWGKAYEFDVLVVTEILGWREIRYSDSHPMGRTCDGCSWRTVGSYRQPGWDYEVLQHMRNSRDPGELQAFYAELEAAWELRGLEFDLVPLACRYIPGDYSLAALIAKQKRSHT
ncbi:MAG TPA: hypothetical protein VF914_11215 [Chloroflexia bacterium]|jgi:hypothetical protein